ncbi:HNH endonuclease [Peribacillus frigoritolerans]|uniref:HNH endonuclease n=1 Tax=Peribacillus frigoritolerans TaxID=450367 RepID=UPI000FD6BED4|nr:HNH endonuclease [Peribacillus frigoritolerans]AZV59681.1 HNH endonuclease [Peribacillus frigoritolerans]
MIGTCELCDRDGVELTVHHLTPREVGGSHLPKSCHKQIHALYSNRELAIRLNTVLLLKDDEALKKYLKWIKKQPVTRAVRIRKSKTK